MRFAAWFWFAVVQLISLVATILGWLLLIPFCLARAWRPVSSTVDPKRTIDEWSWRPLNWVYGNLEDGPSGVYALVWNATGAARVPYMPNAWAPWRAYIWSGWRNSADGLKRLFRWTGGPFKRWEWRGLYAQAGWNSSGFPVMSAGRK
jgi:hypothetical protein